MISSRIWVGFDRRLPCQGITHQFHAWRRSPRLHHRSQSVAVEDRSSRLIVASLPPSISSIVSLQNGFLLTSRARRKKPHCFSCPMPRAWAHPSFGHGASPPLLTSTPSNWGRRSSSIHCLIYGPDQESRYRFAWSNLDHRSGSGWYRFNVIRGSVNGNATVPVHAAVDLFHEFCNRKIIMEFWIIAEALDFCRKAPHLYFIYVLVHANLQNIPKLF
jgi:hypothetical protein